VMLNVSLDDAFEVVRKITIDRNASVSYGQFFLFLQMMDPTHKFVYITRNPSNRRSKYKASLKERSNERSKEPLQIHEANLVRIESWIHDDIYSIRIHTLVTAFVIGRYR
jgi:hypothetical protein